MTGIAEIIANFVVVLGLWLIISSNTMFNGCNLCQEFSSFTSFFFEKAIAKPYWNINSAIETNESEETLGKIIGECYLNPLCFKLPVPENKTK
jgi:hypothetical protein